MIRRFVLLFALLAAVTLSSNKADAGTFYYNGFDLVFEPEYYTVITSYSTFNYCDYRPFSRIYHMFDGQPGSLLAIAWYVIPPGDDLSEPPPEFDPHPSYNMPCQFWAHATAATP